LRGAAESCGISLHGAHAREQEGWLIRKWRLTAEGVTLGSPLFAEAASRPGITEIYVVELQPQLMGQQLGVKLIREALADAGDEAIVVCKPVPTEFSNVQPEESLAAAMAYHQRLGPREDARGVLLSGWHTSSPRLVTPPRVARLSRGVVTLAS
jgi:hypothetical protein